MTAWVSRDGRWRVEPIVLDGRQLLRIAHVEPVVGGELVQPVNLGHGWYLVEDAPSVARVAAYVPLETLREVDPVEQVPHH